MSPSFLSNPGLQFSFAALYPAIIALFVGVPLGYFIARRTPIAVRMLILFSAAAFVWCFVPPERPPISGLIFGIPVTTLLVASAASGIPMRLIQAAAIDGIGALKFFFKIALPYLAMSVVSSFLIGMLFTAGIIFSPIDSNFLVPISIVLLASFAFTRPSSGS